MLVTVTDAGAGISPDMLPRIFDLFTQGDASAQRPGGLGIGLALARRLVELHGGTIDAQSDGIGRGATFTIRLPIADPPVTEIAIDEAETSGECHRRVLVVDDNADAAASLAMSIELRGGTVAIAGDGETAIATALQFKPDLVLLDIGLPGITGYEVCEQLRARLGAEPTIIAVTGWGQPHDKETARRAGFDGHLTKPADPATLGTLLTELTPLLTRTE